MYYSRNLPSIALAHHTMSTASLRLRWSVPPAFLAAWGSWNYASRDCLRADGSSRAWNQKLAYSTSTLHKSDSDNQSTNTSPSNARPESQTAWTIFTDKFAAARESFASVELAMIGDNIKNFILPDWARLLPATVQKLQRELSMAPGSLADDIWKEAHDPYINPEIAVEAKVRVGDSLCPEEVQFRRNRQKHVVKALAKYLDLKEEDIHPDDVPVIAMCGSGGGLRALVAGSGSYLASQEAGLWDCVTYTAGVSGSCWLQTLYNSSLGGCDFNRLVAHLKARLGVHIAFPPKALNLLTTAPTNKYLLSGLVEKLKGDPDADFGLVDIYGLLLAARLLVPRGELDVSDRNLKLSNQKDLVQDGSNPLPIYTAVRHEIPVSDKDDITGRRAVEKVKEEALKEAWFQWFEFTPYELFCEEFSAGIPMWAVGRHFYEGRDQHRDEYPVPELRIPALMGIWGSAFCATLAHYYKEIRPVVRGLAGFGGIDSLIEGKNDELIKVHPFDPASIPNYILGMKGELPESCPESALSNPHLQLMDAGMSNNLPIYPLLRPGRDVDIIVAFDASADIKQENWLSVVDGYVHQRGVQGWPLGAGWPPEDIQPEETANMISEMDELSESKSNEKLHEAQEHDPNTKDRTGPLPDTLMRSDSRYDSRSKKSTTSDTDLTYCNVWLGTKQEMTSDKRPPPSKRLFHPSHGDESSSDFHLMQPDAGIAVIYFPLLPNPSAPDYNPPSTDRSQIAQPHKSASDDDEKAASPIPKPNSINPDVDDFLSTWNFVYTPEQIDSVVGLAKANFAEGEAQVKRVVRGVYERRKRDRLQREKLAKEKAADRQMDELKRRHEGYAPIY
ncbi:phospholipase A2 (PlaA), putative [Talaromyces stipitatus ATCC 10500]|uniref:Lysophospholipase n=1 Tax=Talaromyces stipitatus (strain ATCC 10500 / CBS 375.48 / QM 6759 / NRRL 1006) TaxID=441959 RepID=B8MLJ6_TALSN|nr:phospholipase A2 (PlaA), putative [Talaromyces stipitatus ATCC 10500]EED15529.1 phospholipase A2 (PlaA), putative [Talaromyces stipitatus ATCC 10500]